MTVPAWLGRAYFGVQAIAGGVWWIAVFTVPWVRDSTLGDLNAVTIAILDIPLFVVASAVAAVGARAAALVSTVWTCVVAGALAIYATVTGQAGWGVLLMFAAAAGSVVALSLLSTGRVPVGWIIRGPFAFRPARVRRTTISHVAATFGQIFVFWGLFLVVIPSVIALLEQRWDLAISFPAGTQAVGLTLLGCASALGVWSAIVMSALGRGTPLPSAMANHLVIAGPYRWVRNPMALAGISQGVAVGLILESWLVVAWAVAGSLVWNYVVRPFEETDLEERFGAEFQRYRAAVRCWVPRLPHSEDASLPG
ncbi:protein-S-isoprenylcysteine O-methyltransferase Ste14 [Okibacterium sp. HSC-33S16]|uniref:methyltransferase family protein n=1 Tax=Okibacterium sp. HSC-33S16 TaxID=2910965 RepID=UPI00209EFE02|nr:isoprenylcysteine carboxylmethyltransferase family protein [Okibacterium sp. HSC-33S16]MCP2031119.1 protein-S-isoprenylcysteine O-methyltransferase Ste14 [Okibacterium sp. HSC-33S16]